MKVLVCYFSATGNTGKMAQVISRRLTELGAEVESLDATVPSVRQQKVDMSGYQAAVFGSPIHSMRSPRVFREWLAGLDGQGKKCATFFTYGGFQVHPTHFTTARILEKSRFNLVASAEFLGAHTFNLAGWEAMTERPDDSDQAVAREFAEKIFARFTGEDSGLVTRLDEGPYTEEELDKFESFRFVLFKKPPDRQGDGCSMCLLCQEQCPTGAMNAETGQADPNLCILCLRCFKECPDEVLKITDAGAFFSKKMAMDKETPETLRAKKSRIYL